MKYKHIRSKKYISISSDSQAALKALKTVRTTSPLVYQCQAALNDISARHVMGLFGSPGMPVYVVMRSQMGSQGLALLGAYLDRSRPWGSLEAT
jgi:hypothetical protein